MVVRHQRNVTTRCRNAHAKGRFFMRDPGYPSITRSGRARGVTETPLMRFDRVTSMAPTAGNF